MIVLENVIKTFTSAENNVSAVDDVSLEIEQGEIYGIIGFSGAGKSTLVRCINLLEVPTSGKVFLNDTDLLCDCHSLYEDKTLRRTDKYLVDSIEQHNPLKGYGYYPHGLPDIFETRMIYKIAQSRGREQTCFSVRYCTFNKL